MNKQTKSTIQSFSSVIVNYSMSGEGRWGGGLHWQSLVSFAVEGLEANAPETFKSVEFLFEAVS